MAGIYIHIPFCLQKCNYCNFFSVPDLSLKDLYCQALCKEMLLRKDYLNSNKISTLYFGGGTPSLLSAQQIENIITSAQSCFNFSSDAEITLEANPNCLTNNYLYDLSHTSINRLSIGIESFFDENLQILGRIHTARQAEEALQLSDKHGFKNISIDLMYGYPLLNKQQWSANLEKVKYIPHLSCYCLHLEPYSPMYQSIKSGKYTLPDESEILEQYQILKKFMQKYNFSHYEISNFCQNNCFSKHNLSYWQNEPYLGLGTAAHSFNLHSRQWNLCDIALYINELNKIKYPSQWENQKGILFDSEQLTPQMQFNEYIMTSLRTQWGCDLNFIETRFTGAVDYLQKNVKKLHPDLYLMDANTLSLTEKGFLLADRIACELFVEKEMSFIEEK